MDSKKFLNKNEIVVIGTLVENGLELRDTQAGQTIIAGPISVKTVIDGEEQVFEFRLFSYQYKKNTTEVSGLFKTYSSLDDKIGKKIRVVGEIAENRFFQDRTGQIVSFNYNQGRFIYDSKEEDDVAKFTYSGYVEKPLVERTNKEGETLHYEISIGQASYDVSKKPEPTVVKFQVDPTATKAIRYMEKNYERGTTVTVSGVLGVEVEPWRIEEETAFGDPNVKEGVNIFKSYKITSGSEPIYGKNEYTTSEVREFSQAYEDDAVRIQQDAASKEKVTVKTEAKKTNASSLL